MKREELELYLHIPFCVKKCNYCDFLSASGCEEEKEAYVRAMLREIQSYREEARKYEVKTVFLGGGTPSLLTCAQTEAVFEYLNRVFHIAEDAEITMEVNPGTVTPEKLESYRRAGVNRLSIGLQSVHDKELKMLGRIHTYEEFLATWQQAREAGFENLNVDLMSGLPGQSLEDWTGSLHKVTALEPEHISAYSLILEEGTAFYQWYEQGRFAEGEELALPAEEEEYAMGEAAIQILGQAGYHRYEISNYALPGRECRHNLGYWERKNYLGIGSGAASLIQNVRFHHVRDRQEYIRKLTEPDVNGCGKAIQSAPRPLDVNWEKLSVSEQMEEFMFLGLRKTAGISRKVFAEYFGKEIEHIYGAVIQKLTEENLLEQTGNMLRLTHRGMDVSNLALSEFLLDEACTETEEL